MIEFLIREEPFKLRLAEKVPVPKDGECFLLYQSGGGENKSLVLSNGIKYSSTEVRHGHYNQIVTFSLKNKNFYQRFRIVMKNIDFYFNVTVKISYFLQDVQKLYFRSQVEEEDIHHTIRDIIRKQDGKWDVQQGWEIQGALERDIEQRLKQYEGIKFRIQEVEVVPDDEAVKMLQSNREKTVGIHVTANKTDEEIAMKEQEKRIADSDQELKLKKIEEMAFMVKNFGNFGPVVSEYLDGNINGEQLYDYIMKAKTNDMSMLNIAVSNDLMTQEEGFEKLKEILSNDGFLKEEKQQLINKNESRVEEKNMDEIEAISPSEGDYI